MIAKRLDAIWLVITRIFWLALIGGGIGLIVVMAAPKYYQRNELNRRIRDMRERNRDLERAVHRLEIQQQRFVTDPAFVERTARELGMARPGEVIYKYFAEDIED